MVQRFRTPYACSQLPADRKNAQPSTKCLADLLIVVHRFTPLYLRAHRTENTLCGGLFSIIFFAQVVLLFYKTYSHKDYQWKEVVFSFSILIGS